MTKVWNIISKASGGNDLKLADETKRSMVRAKTNQKKNDQFTMKRERTSAKAKERWTTQQIKEINNDDQPQRDCTESY